MRSIVVLACAFALGACASAAPAVATSAAPIALMPRWAEPAATLAAPRPPLSGVTVLDGVAPRRTVVIAPEAERDPVDQLMRARRGNRRLRDFALRDAPVGETLRMFAELGGFNVVVTDEVSARRVTLSLRDVSLATAFRAVLSIAHLGATVIGGEVVEVRPASST